LEVCESRDQRVLMAERDEDDEEESQVVRKGDDAKAHKELNKLGGDMDGEKEVDTGKAQDALTKLATAEEAEKARKLERERELAKVKIEKADVELIMTGFVKPCCFFIFANDDAVSS